MKRCRRDDRDTTERYRHTHTRTNRQPETPPNVHDDRTHNSALGADAAAAGVKNEKQHADGATSAQRGASSASAR